jgi:hypothetical protein
VAAAVGEGITTLHYNGSKLSTYTTVSVVQVSPYKGVSESRQLESRPRAAARLGLGVSAGCVSPASRACGVATLCCSPPALPQSPAPRCVPHGAWCR